MKTFAASCFLLLCSNVHTVFGSNGIRGAELSDEQDIVGKGRPGRNIDSMPDFLDEDELPPGLVNNPSKAVGVDFKKGKTPKGQKTPKLSKKKKKATIRGLDNKPIKIDLETAERINVYHPDQFTLSSDGTYVTDNDSGELFKLNVYYAEDKKNQLGIKYSLDDEGYLNNVRVTPKMTDDGNGRKLKKDKEKADKIQNFQRLKDDEEILVGYVDDDVDKSKLPIIDSSDDDYEEDADEEDPNEENGSRQRRRAQNTTPTTRFGKTCTAWDWLDVRIATDKKFRNRYPDHKAKAQEVFAEAAEIYWKESCVWLWMWSYESTVGNSNWVTPDGRHIDTRFSPTSIHNGCNGSYGALDIFQATVRARRSSAYRDAWHLFSGTRFHYGKVGCAYINACKSKDRGYGVNNITFTTNLRLQAVLFAHELGHNLSLRHYNTPGTPGYWVMEKRVNFAPYDLHPTNANIVRQKVVYSSACGWN